MKIIIGIIIVIAVVLVGYNILQGPTTQVPIKIGFIAPLTGDAAAYGEPERDGVAIAVKEINAAGGVNGRPIQVVYEDGKCTGKDAVSAVQKLINIDKIKFVIGGACSGETLGMAPITEAAKTILFSPSASNPDISQAGDYVFRNYPSDAGGGKIIAESMYQDYKKAAVITENTDYAQGLRKVFVDRFGELGGKIVFDESFVPETLDFRSVLSKMKAATPEAIFINPQTGAAAARIAKQAREIGLAQQFYLFFVTGADYVESGPAAEGSIILDVELDETSAKGGELVDKYVAEYGKRPTYPIFAGAAYDALYLLADGIKKYGENPDKVKQYLYDLPNYSGTIGTYSFDQNGDVVGLEYVIKHVVDGKAVEMK